MKKYKSQKEFEADIKDGIFYSEESIDITDFSLQVECSIKVLGNIDARDIKARDIEARDISFYAVAFAYISFACKSIIGRRQNSKFFCLDSEVKINK